MNVSLTPELERYVKAKVKSGYYNNASEVVREALREMILLERATESRGEARGLTEKRVAYEAGSPKKGGRTSGSKASPTREPTGRALERLKAAIAEGDASPDAEGFSFAKLRASLDAEDRRRKRR